MQNPIYLLLDTSDGAGVRDLPVQLFESEVHIIADAPTVTLARSAYTLETEEAERISVDQVCPNVLCARLTLRALCRVAHSAGGRCLCHLHLEGFASPYRRASHEASDLVAKEYRASHKCFARWQPDL